MSYQRYSVTCFKHTANHFTVPRYGTYRMHHSTRLTFLGARLLGDCGECRIALTVTYSSSSCPAITLLVFLLNVLYLLPTVASPVSTIKSHLLHVMHAYHFSIIFVVIYTLYVMYFIISIIYFPCRKRSV